MSQQQPKAEFSNVDQATNPQSYIHCLDFQHTLSFNQAYKQRTFDLLAIQPGQNILDIGCGTGEDALTMATYVGEQGHVVGLDFSQTMIDEATRRAQTTTLPISFMQGNIYQLPFADNSLAGCRADKTFQHLAEPVRALTEMLRVTKPGGMLVIVVCITTYVITTGRKPA